MSQKSASSAPAPSRVSGGVPWWLWGILVLVGGTIIASIVSSSIPEDPEKIYDQVIAGINSQNKQMADTNLAKLRAYPEYAKKCQLLDGMLELAGARPVKAIKTLEAIVDDKDVRPLALRSLGSAYAQADQRWKAIETFELLLKEDPKSDEARFSLALLHFQNLSWDEARKHIDDLVDSKYQPESVLQMKADVYEELGEFNTAIDALSESINAKANDPSNGTKASNLLTLMAQGGQTERAEDFLQYVDQAMIRNFVEAEKLLKKGDVAGAQNLAMDMRKENPLALLANKFLSKVMLAYGTKEKAVEGLALLRATLQGQRDIDLYRNVAAIARLAGNEPYAALVQQNVDQLEELDKRFSEKLQQVVKTVDDAAIRLELFQLAAETGRFKLAIKVIDGLEGFYPDRASEWVELKKKLLDGMPQLVNTMSDSDLEQAAAAAVEARASAGLPPGVSQALPDAPAGAPEATAPVPSEPAAAEPAPSKPAPKS
jgi:lipopolysaccharide biosynthesis regulator YciM